MATSSPSATRGTYDRTGRTRGSVSTWGVMLARHGAGGLEGRGLQTVGNTKTPMMRGVNGRAVRNAEGSPITSPKARYFQWRAVLNRHEHGGTNTDVAVLRISAA